MAGRPALCLLQAHLEECPLDLNREAWSVSSRWWRASASSMVLPHDRGFGKEVGRTVRDGGGVL
jgi:hypothetical protein